MDSETCMGSYVETKAQKELPSKKINYFQNKLNYLQKISIGLIKVNYFNRLIDFGLVCNYV